MSGPQRGLGFSGRKRMTRQGYDAARKEQHYNRKEQSSVDEEFDEFRRRGTYPGDPEYDSAWERDRYLGDRQRDLRDSLDETDVVDPSERRHSRWKHGTGGQADFGSRVTVEDEETGERSTYEIVGEDEADWAKGRISETSPLAKSLMGRRPGDPVTVGTPSGSRRYRLRSVR